MNARPRAERTHGREVDLSVEAIHTASATDIGRVRAVNQDACGEWRSCERQLHLLFVADGMGGHRGGEVASRLAVESADAIFERGAESPEALLRGAFDRANRCIFEASSADPSLRGMGTTGVALLFAGGPSALVAHVGDSRAYRLRGGALSQLTGDHSVVGELVRRGQLTPEQARTHPQSNEILRAIGTQPEVEVELTPIEVEPGDRYLLCSDGLSGMLPDDRIRDVLADEDPASAVKTLVRLANEAGGTDNITLQIAAAPERAQTDTRGRGRGLALPLALTTALFIAYLLLRFGRGG